MENELENLRNRLFKIFIDAGLPTDEDKEIIVHHYTSAENALKIIASKEIWLRHPSTMNDYGEVRHGFEIIDEIVSSDEIKNILNSITEQIGDNFVELFNKYYLNLKSSSRSKIYLACFTKHVHPNEDDLGRLSMWRAYGSGTNKAAIRLDLSKATKATGLMFVPAIYAQKSEVAEYLQNALKDFIQYRNVIDGSTVTVDQLARMLSILFCLLAISLKHVGFYEEREWRLVFLPYASEIKNFVSYSTESVNGIPQIVYKVPLSEEVNGEKNHLALSKILQNIMIGPTPYTWSIGEAFDQALHNAGFDDPYELTFFSAIPLR